MSNFNLDKNFSRVALSNCSFIDSSHAEQRLFKQAVALMSRGEYRRALDSFSLFQKKYPESLLSPDVHLHRADCYLHLSGDQGSEPAPQ